MQIVIDVPDEWEKDTSIPTNDEFADLIVNGTPLLKGHGRLIDADMLIKYVCGHSCGCNVEECGNDIFCHEVLIIQDAPTIIEADKAESEE